MGRGAPPGKLDVILNSADEAIFDAERHPPRERTPGRFELIIHGTIEERYGIDTTIEALALLANEIPELELHVFGKGSYREELERLAAERGVADRVHIRRDFVPLDDLVHAISQADAGVVAMKRDPFRDLTHCNKMYELITMRRPQLMSRTRSVEAYFDEDCFAWFDVGRPGRPGARHPPPSRGSGAGPRARRARGRTQRRLSVGAPARSLPAGRPRRARARLKAEPWRRRRNRPRPPSATSRATRAPSPPGPSSAAPRGSCGSS